MFQCHVCGSNVVRQEIVDDVFKLNGKHVLVEGIPAKIYARCGDKTLSAPFQKCVKGWLHVMLSVARHLVENRDPSLRSG